MRSLELPLNSVGPMIGTHKRRAGQKARNDAGTRPKRRGERQMASMASLPGVPGLRASFTASLRAFAHDLFDDYHPERHYMRGPGPKWREKHGREPASTPAATPLFPDSIPA